MEPSAGPDRGSAELPGALGGPRRFAALTRWAPALALAPLLLLYHLLYGRFFPTGPGTVGDDYSLSLPALLAGYYWIRVSGLFAVPWFTPAFCGGQPFLADAQSIFYSLPQLATLAFDPLTSCYLTMLVSAGLGYAGTWLLLRRRFDAGGGAAFFGATVFMFNGFFAHRMLVGHVGFHGFMLVPMFALALLGPAGEARPREGCLPLLSRGTVAGLIAAYWVESAFGTMILPAGLAVAVLVLLDALRRDRFDAAPLAARSVVAAGVGAAVSAAKLVAVASFMTSFPRSHYPLPGFRSVADAAGIAFQGLFLSTSGIEARSASALTNAQWALQRHELEYGVTPVPLAIVLLVAVAVATRGRLPWVTRTGTTWRARRFTLAAALVALLALPVLLNVHSPGWSALLKATPVVGSSSTLVRWFCVYVPFVAVVSGLAVQRLAPRLRLPVAIVGAAAILAANFLQDRADYAAPGYSPANIAAAYRAAAAGGGVPSIAGNAVFLSDGVAAMPLGRNDTLVSGRSQLLCYNPSFGYGLERLPLGSLRAGSVWETRGGRFNLKNPACYVFPEENRCSPGDHFLASQRSELDRFVRYQPFDFEVSAAQRLAGVITVLGLLGAVGVLAVAAGRAIRRAVARP